MDCSKNARTAQKRNVKTLKLNNSQNIVTLYILHEFVRMYIPKMDLVFRYSQIFTH